jgi:hypothetical protein
LAVTSANAAEPQYFSPSDVVEYDIVELKLIKPGEASCIIMNRDPKVREAKGRESRKCELVTDYTNDKGNGFYVNVPPNTWLTVGDNIEVVYTDPAFAKPEDTSKATSKTKTGVEYQFRPGESVFFGEHSEKTRSFAVWFYAVE